MVARRDLLQGQHDCKQPRGEIHGDLAKRPMLPQLSEHAARSPGLPALSCRMTGTAILAPAV